MGGRAAKDALYDALARAGKAIGNGRRAELVDVLAQGERSVDELAAEIEQTVANTSQHLQLLLRAGLVTNRRDGTRIRYALSSPQVALVWAALRDVAAAHVADIDDLAAAYLGDRGELETISRHELHSRLRRQDVVVFDVRPAVEYRAGHIGGAESVPLSELQDRMRDLPNGVQVVAYCRGPFCVYADDAVRSLAKQGVRAARLEDGFPEWAREDLPVQEDMPAG
jgi:rhodanese-related sulfurtransferase